MVDNGNLGFWTYHLAERDLEVLRRWNRTINNPVNPIVAIVDLKRESQDVEGKSGTRMAHYLNMAIDKYNGVSTDLCEAECVVLGMYTADDDANAFYKELNAATRKQQYIPYHVFSSVLLSAVTKLASTSPLKPGTTVFRGLGSPVHVPTEVPKAYILIPFCRLQQVLILRKINSRMVVF